MPGRRVVRGLSKRGIAVASPVKVRIARATVGALLGLWLAAGAMRDEWLEQAFLPLAQCGAVKGKK